VGVDVSVVDSAAAWGVINNLCDGSIGLAYQKANAVSGVDGVSVNINLARSIDGGITWSKRTVAVAPVFTDSLGNLNVAQFRNIAFGQTKSGRILISFAKIIFKYSSDGRRINDSASGNIFFHEGLYLTSSDDMGNTFGEIKIVDTREIVNASGHYKIISISENEILMSVYGYIGSNFKKSASGILRSHNDGISWTFDLIANFDSAPYGETSLTYFDGKLIAIVRNGPDVDSLERLSQYLSYDLGKTWESPTFVTRDRELPGGIFIMQQKPMLTYGSRTYPYGVGALLSFDGGLSYDDRTRVSLVYDSPPIPQGGYANGVETNGNNAIITYYTMPGNSVYKQLWFDSEVRIVKFNSEKFSKLWE